jgi:hypothetical protein
MTISEEAKSHHGTAPDSEQQIREGAKLLLMATL